MSMFYSIVKFNLMILILINQINQSLSANYNNDDNRTRLQRAVAASDIDAIKELLPKVDINQQDSFGGTALHTAVSMIGGYPNLIIVALLLDHPLINTKITNMNSYTAARCAKTYNHDKALNMLEYHDELIAMQQAQERKLSEDRKSESRLSETSLNAKQQKALESAKQNSILSYFYRSK